MRNLLKPPLAMAEPRYRPPRSPAARALRVAGMNAAIFVGALLLVWLGYKLLHRPHDAGPGVPTPRAMTVGDAPGPLVSGDYRLRLDGVRWVDQDSLPAGLQLSFRARPSAVVDYLVLEVSVTNMGGAEAPLTFADAGQNVRLLVVSNDPQSVYVEPIDPREASLISGAAAFQSGPLSAGATRRGVLVYPIERFRKGLKLVFVPAYPPATAPRDGPQQPAIAMRFSD